MNQNNCNIAKFAIVCPHPNVTHTAYENMIQIKEIEEGKGGEYIEQKSNKTYQNQNINLTSSGGEQRIK